jgi:hypothetical protein
MSSTRKATNEQIIAAYQKTGSPWKAAKLLGMCGQSVWERLKRLNVPMTATHWSDDEKAEAVNLANNGCTLSEIANRLGRPYAGVAGMLSSMGVRIRRRRITKAPRKRLSTPWNAMKWMMGLQSSNLPVSRYARVNGLDTDLVVHALQLYQQEFWQSYVKAHAVAPPKACPYCHREFYPLSHKQVCCTRRCQSHHRVNRNYFGGNRQSATGLADGICQLCLQAAESLHVHHEIGKQHDPNNEHLVALCKRCHHFVETLTLIQGVEGNDFWARLIVLVNTRRFGSWADGHVGVGVNVYIDWLTADDVDEEGAA